MQKQENVIKFDYLLLISAFTLSPFFQLAGFGITSCPWAQVEKLVLACLYPDFDSEDVRPTSMYFFYSQVAIMIG